MALTPDGTFEWGAGDMAQAERDDFRAGCQKLREHDFLFHSFSAQFWAASTGAGKALEES